MTKPNIQALLLGASILLAPVNTFGATGKQRSPSPKLTPSRVVADVAAANRAATVEPSTPAFRNAVQIYPFSEGTIYRVITAPERVTDISLQAGETVVAVASGDTARWVIGDTTSGAGDTKRTHILVKPFTAGLATNLIITTDRRSYHLSLLSASRTAMTGLTWIYPLDSVLALKPTTSDVAKPIAPPSVPVEQLRFNYSISGDRPAWRPLRAFDDGRQTFIEFPPTLPVDEAPPLFLVNDEGDAELVNYRVRGRYYIVDRLFDVAELRLGTRKQTSVRISRDVADAHHSRRGS